jgi:hypothetical protein
MNKSRLLATVCAIALAVFINSTQAAIVTYNFENTNFSGFYTFDRDAAVIISLTSEGGGSTYVIDYGSSVIDYEFTVNFSQINFSQTFTPDNSNPEGIENAIFDGVSTMSIDLSDSSNSFGAFNFYILTWDISHPYDPGDDPLNLPPPLDYFYTNDGGLSQAVFHVDNGGQLLVNGEQYDDYLDSPYVTVSASVVPIPAAIWLFGSGLFGLIGIARHKKM